MQVAVPSQTAERVALTRALESRLPESRRLCWDPYAKLFLQGRLKRIYHSWLRRKIFCFLSDRRVPGVMGAVVLRTRFMDDFLVAQVRAGTTQVVNLGAGYDSRAFRFRKELENAVVFEVDHPATQQRKAAVVKTAMTDVPANLVFVPVRFNRENLKERLMSQGYRPEAKTAFIWEGVTYYLSSQSVDRTLRFVAGHSASGSAIAFDFFPPSVVDGSSQLKEARSMHAIFRMFGEGLTFGVAPDEMPAFLTSRGYNRVRLFSYRQLKASYLRGSNRHCKVSTIFSIAQASV